MAGREDKAARETARPAWRTEGRYGSASKKTLQRRQNMTKKTVKTRAEKAALAQLKKRTRRKKARVRLQEEAEIHQGVFAEAPTEP